MSENSEATIESNSVESISAVGDVRSNALAEVGIDTVDDVKNASVDDLTSADGIGNSVAKTMLDDVAEEDDDQIWNGVDAVSIVAGNDFEDVGTKEAVGRIERAMQASPYSPTTVVVPEDGNGKMMVDEWRKFHSLRTDDDLELEVVVGDFPGADLWEKNETAYRAAYGEAVSERDTKIGQEADAVVVVEDGEYVERTVGNMEAAGCETFRHVEEEAGEMEWDELSHVGGRTKVAIVDGPESYQLVREDDIRTLVDDALAEVGVEADVVGRYNRMDDTMRAAEVWQETEDVRAERVFHAPWDEYPEGMKGEAAKVRDFAMMEWADVIVVVRQGEYTDLFLDRASGKPVTVVQSDVDGVEIDPKPDMEFDESGPSKTERTANSDPELVDEDLDDVGHEGPFDERERDDNNAGAGAGTGGNFLN